MSKVRIRTPARKPVETVQQLATRERLAAVKRHVRHEKEITRLTKSLMVLIGRRDRVLREFAEFVLERDGDATIVPKLEVERERELANV